MFLCTLENSPVTAPVNGPLVTAALRDMTTRPARQKIVSGIAVSSQARAYAALMHLWWATHNVPELKRHLSWISGKPHGQNTHRIEKPQAEFGPLDSPREGPCFSSDTVSTHGLCLVQFFAVVIWFAFFWLTTMALCCIRVRNDFRPSSSRSEHGARNLSRTMLSISVSEKFGGAIFKARLLTIHTAWTSRALTWTSVLPAEKRLAFNFFLLSP